MSEKKWIVNGEKAAELLEATQKDVCTYTVFGFIHCNKSDILHKIRNYSSVEWDEKRNCVYIDIPNSKFIIE